MIDIAKGRWWDLPWSLVDGCTPCSPGCEHCWSLAMEKRFRPKADYGNGWKEPDRSIQTHPERLSIPLKRRKPTVWAVWNDWCHEGVDHVFRHKAVIQAEFSEQHTFLALTKRPQVMLDFWKSGIQHVPANWWSGLTVCNQAESDAKIPVFLKVPGKKFLSIEPMLGPINIITVPGPRQPMHDIDAVILGGETGPGARPLHPDWVRSVRDQCAAAGVPFFFKGWGEWSPDDFSAVTEHGRTPQRKFVTPDGRSYDYCHVGTTSMMHVKSRLLDGRTHDDLPWVTK